MRRRAVALGKLTEQVRVLHHVPGEIRRDLVHHLVLRQRHAGAIRLFPVPLHDLGHFVNALFAHMVLHSCLAEFSVLGRGEVLHTVCDLVCSYVQIGLVAVYGNLDQVLVPDVLAVGLTAHNAVHELDTHTQLFAHRVQRGRRALAFGDDRAGIDVIRQTCARRGGHAFDLRVLPCHLCRRVLQTGIVRRISLLRCQHGRIRALRLACFNAVQPGIVHAGESCIQGGHVLRRPAHLLIRFLPSLQKAACGLLCASLRDRGSRGTLRLRLRRVAACKGGNVTFQLADGLLCVQLHAGVGLQRLHGHRILGNSRRLIAGDALAPRHSVHSLCRLAVHLRCGVLPHVAVILRFRRVICRAVGKGVEADLPSAQKAAHDGTTCELFRSCRRVENSAVAHAYIRVIPTIDGVLHGAFNHALHHFLFTFLQHGIHP